MSRQLSESDIFRLLAKRRRRLALRFLNESATPVTARSLAEHIGEREFENPSDDDVRTVHLTLNHTHLPRLDATDVVTHDRDEGTVRPGLNFDLVVRVLEGVSERERPWTDDDE